MKKSYLIIISLILWTTSYSQNQEKNIWKSNEEIFCIEYNNNWIVKEISPSELSKIEGIDFINKSKSAILKLRIISDEKISSISDNRYYEKIKSELLGKKELNNTLAVEEDADFKEIEFRKMLLYLDLDGRSDKKTIYTVYVKRLGDKYIEIHYYYILDIYDGWLFPPPDLTKLINSLKIEI
ncbi:hypothetical protein [Aequorivita antarctica]|uniref:Uncharacterized protein n=1 Tax=Aequorivita antarctica TaxID=153266 RepID=A0A5C6YW64_9FLAO|nr:hypothetical protein [Aequorivita antarctica]TXD71266.1 hypothetical protein ESU54_17480 [Aequorivita antarctica]SRX75893.1 hypothetical protein AEQU3_02890 [Aequorivita antarctica]